ncbi:MAG: hypothetical protein H0Z40_03525 [Desulfotomaculum sp.]|nr:hypothetical protein [Desulfotomaculum sp.]
MITASRDILVNVLTGEWKGLNVRVLQISNDGGAYSKVFKLEDFLFDEIDACENCRAPSSYCNDCDGVVEILALVGTVKVNKRSVEDGLVVPLLGDVMFDLREGHIAILCDTDVIIISRAGNKTVLDDDKAEIDNLTPGDYLSNVRGKDEKIKMRLYLVNENKIKRIAVNALQDGRLFKDLAGKKAVGLEIMYVQQDKKPLYIRSLRLFNIYFDLDGNVNQELTFPKKQGENPKQYSGKKVVEIGRRDKEPELTKDQKEAIRKKLLKDFGQEVWDNTPMVIKAVLE